MVLALVLYGALAAVVLASWLTAEVEVATGEATPRLAVVVRFWRWRRTRTWKLAWKPAPGGGGGPTDWGAVVRGVRIYLGILDALAARAEVRRVSLEGDFSTGDPALTAWIYGAAAACWTARWGAGQGGDCVFGLSPRWNTAGFRITARGIFRWRVAHIITAAGASLLRDAVRRQPRRESDTVRNPGDS
jgi:hypothetical protein